MQLSERMTPEIERKIPEVIDLIMEEIKVDGGHPD